MSADHVQLMRYHDGELDAEERALVERRLAVDPEARAVLDALSRIGDEVRADQRERPWAGVDLTEAVMQKVARQSRLPLPRLLRRAAPAAAAGLALAAGVALWLSDRPVPVAPPQIALSHAPAPKPAPAELESAAPAALAVDNGPVVAIENVEFGEGTGAIFMVPGAEQETTVVWLSDERDDSSGMEHL